MEVGSGLFHFPLARQSPKDQDIPLFIPGDLPVFNIPKLLQPRVVVVAIHLTIVWMGHLGRATAGHSSRRRSGPKCGGGSAHAAHCGIGSDRGGRRPHYSNHAPPHPSSSHPLPALTNPKVPFRGPTPAPPPPHTRGRTSPQSARAHTHTRTQTTVRGHSLRAEEETTTTQITTHEASQESSFFVITHQQQQQPPPPPPQTPTLSFAFNSFTPSPLPFRVGSSRGWEASHDESCARRRREEKRSGAALACFTSPLACEWWCLSLWNCDDLFVILWSRPLHRPSQSATHSLPHSLLPSPSPYLSAY